MRVRTNTTIVSQRYINGTWYDMGEARGLASIELNDEHLNRINGYVVNDYTCDTRFYGWMRPGDRHPCSDRVIWYLILGTECGPNLALRGSRATYDIMHNGGYLALPTYIGERRFEIECVVGQPPFHFPYSVTRDLIGHIVTQ